MKLQKDILENEILLEFPGVLEILLKDNTTKGNIIWGTESYEHLGREYLKSSPITLELITGVNGNFIMPRVEKDESLQKTRSKGMAEVYTAAWICNSQNNLIDDAWFSRRGVFNTETDNSWQTNLEPISFPIGKSWIDYVEDTRLEMACGEAPYITSRYDATTGEFIDIPNRIGLLDRKLRVINENIKSSGEWLKASQLAYKNIYGFEWQGDSLLLAREALLTTFIENFKFKFGKMPTLASIASISKIISWNIWQMDGLKGVIPYSCKTDVEETFDLFGEKQMNYRPCIGCVKSDILKHNGIYCKIKDWSKKNGKEVKFIELLKGGVN